MKVKTTRATLLKALPLQSTQLAPQHMERALAGEVFAIKSRTKNAGHFELANGWFIFAGHAEILNDKEYLKTAAELITHFEGLKLEAYLCSARVWTIGIGNTKYPNGAPIKAGDKITYERALEIFQFTLEEFESQLTVLPEWPTLNDNQKAALLSFTFNVGISAYVNSTLRKTIRANSSELAIREQFARWNKGGGKVLPGLTRRRQAETDLYFS